MEITGGEYCLDYLTGCQYLPFLKINFDNLSSGDQIEGMEDGLGDGDDPVCPELSGCFNAYWPRQGSEAECYPPFLPSILMKIFWGDFPFRGKTLSFG
jgi:hypothetical protein